MLEILGYIGASILLVAIVVVFIVMAISAYVGWVLDKSNDKYDCHESGYVDEERK